MMGVDESAKRTAELFKEKEKQFVPEILEKRRKYTRSKGKVEFYKKLSAAIMVLALGIGYLLCMALRGNLNLAKQLEKSKTTIILPNGNKVVTR